MMIPCLGVHRREMAGQVIDSILSLPTNIPDGRDNNLHPEPQILFDVALNISKYDLDWTDERQEQFQNLLQEVEV